MYAEWRHSLDQRLNAAERTFILGDFAGALRQADAVLQEFIILSDGPQLLDVDQRPPTHGCISEAGVALGMQAMYELGQWREVDAYLLRYYSSLSKMPLTLFVLWSKLHAHVGNSAHVAAVTTQLLLASQHRLTAEQYEGLVEVLLFRGLVPCGKRDEAVAFVRANKRVRPGPRQALLDYLATLAAAEGAAMPTSAGTAGAAGTVAAEGPGSAPPVEAGALAGPGAAATASSSSSTSSTALPAPSPRPSPSPAPSPTASSSSSTFSFSQPESWAAALLRALQAGWARLEAHPSPRVAQAVAWARRTAAWAATSPPAQALWRLRFALFWSAVAWLAWRGALRQLRALASVPILRAAAEEAGKLLSLLMSFGVGSRY